jgi:hypothetical protein
MSAIKSGKTKLSKEDSKNKDELSKKIIKNQIDKIKDYEKNVVSNIKNNNITEPEVIKSAFSLSDGAMSQLERGGASFTKPDLIAIIIALDSGKIALMNDLQKLRISDLNSIIRSIIYDTNRYMIATNNNFMNMHIENASEKKSNIREITDVPKNKEKKPTKKNLQISNGTDNSQVVLYK